VIDTDQPDKVMFFGLNIDRGNLGLAVSANLLKDLGLYVILRIRSPLPFDAQSDMFPETPTTITMLRICTASASSSPRFPVSS
jgi:hypothetical protein